MKPLTLFCLYMFSALAQVAIAQNTPVRFSPENKPAYNDTRKASASFSTLSLDCKTSPLNECVEFYLYGTYSELHDNRSSLRFDQKIESPLGFHLAYTQLFNNTPVFGAGIKINLDKRNNIISSFNCMFDVSSWGNPAFPDISEGQKYVSNVFPGCKLEQTEEIMFFDGESAIAALKLKVFIPVHNTTYLMIVGPGGDLLYKKDLSLYLLPPDSLVKVKVFNPDPLTTAMKTYQAPYIDSSDVDIPELNAERVIKNIRTKFLNDTFYLSNDFVEIQEIDAPVYPVPYSLSDSFFYTRSQEEFEAVNAFYHISTAQEHIQSLGFMNLVNLVLPVDAHGFGGVDNSVFKYDPGPPRLLFGDGGVDDAEDADVIIHEYHHAVSFSAAPFTVQGADRQALEEGICDYMAASYSRMLNPFNWQKIYNWDGNFAFKGRTCETTRMYPKDLTPSIHQNGEIWSSAMMKIWEDLGRDKTDALMLSSLYSYSSFLTMPQAAHLILQSDSILNGGVNYHTIYYRFVERGILEWNVGIPGSTETNGIRILGTYEFATGSGNAGIELPEAYSTGSMQLSDELGRIVKSHDFKSQSSIEISPEGLKPGIYIVTVSTGSSPVSFKLVKF